jgi:hypothetical protein
MSKRGISPNDSRRIGSLAHLERRRVHRVMQIDRRASDIDIVERITLGLRCSQISAANDTGLRPSKRP